MEDEAPSIGEFWYAKVGQVEALIIVAILDVTPKTIEIGFVSTGSKCRVERINKTITFIERVKR